MEDFFSLSGDIGIGVVLLLLLPVRSKAWPDWDLGRGGCEGEVTLELGTLLGTCLILFFI